jgi:hypothetical protein
MAVHVPHAGHVSVPERKAIEYYQRTVMGGATLHHHSKLTARRILARVRPELVEPSIQDRSGRDR